MVRVRVTFALRRLWRGLWGPGRDREEFGRLETWRPVKRFAFHSFRMK